MSNDNIQQLLDMLRQEEEMNNSYEQYKSGKTRRTAIPPNKKHRDRKNDYSRKGSPQHKEYDNDEDDYY